MIKVEDVQSLLDAKKFMNKSEIGQIMGFTRQTIKHKIEGNISVSEIEDIAEMCGVPIMMIDKRKIRIEKATIASDEQE